MSANTFARLMVYITLLSLALIGCARTPYDNSAQQSPAPVSEKNDQSGSFHPPYNNFQKPPPQYRRSITGAGLGVIAGSLIGGTAIGGAIGGLVGAGIGMTSDLRHGGINGTIRDLQNNDIQFIQYGDTMVLVIPTDHYFEFNSPKLNELCFLGLNNIIKLLRQYKCSTVYVAGFTDNVGTKQHKKRLSQAQAETMLTFLWANNIPAKRLSAEGYADKFDIGDNRLIHGSAYNRRIEILWETRTPVAERAPVVTHAMK